MLEQAFIVCLMVVCIVAVLYVRRRWDERSVKARREHEERLRQARLDRLKGLIAQAIKEEDKVFEAYKKLAKRERRREEVPSGEVWKALQAMVPRFRAYERLCDEIEEVAAELGSKVMAEGAINRVRSKLDPLEGAPLIEGVQSKPAAA